MPTPPAAGAVRLVVGFLINALVLWIAQKAVLPSDKEKGLLSVAALALLGSVVSWFLSAVIPFWLLYELVYLAVWIWMIAKWFDVGYVLAAAIAFVAWLVHLAVGLVIGAVKLAASVLP